MTTPPPPAISWTLLFLSLALLLSGCSDTNMEEIEIRHGKAYRKSSGKVFSGSVVAYFPRQGDQTPRVYMTGAYSMGLKDGHWITHKWNGEKEDATFVDGRREGVTKWYYPQERIKREQRYSMNMMHGEGAEYDTNGQATRKVFYDRGRLIPPPPGREKDLDDLTRTGQDQRGFFEKMLSGVSDFMQ